MQASDDRSRWDEPGMALARRSRVFAFAILLGAVFSSSPHVMAVEGAGAEGASHRTGNAWIDARLLDMDAYAARYRDAFVDEIVRYHEAPRALVESALADDAMSAGDVYYACSLAQAIGQPCRALVDAWRDDAGDGWEGVTRRLGVAQLASIHRRIRGDIAESYVRWARPLDAGGTSPR